MEESAVSDPAGEAAPLAIPAFARVHLAHAVVQHLAEREGIRLLHLKGPALVPGLRPPGRQSGDADVLVHPDDWSRTEQLLRTSGWEPKTRLSSGSAFQHAANWWHPHWGYLDLHALWPGPTVSAEDTFAAFSEDGLDIEIAHHPCPAPSRTAQILVLLLHGARSTSDHDLRRTWHDQSPEQRQQVLALADRLGARVALAAALGNLGDFRADPSHDLWRFYRQGGSRVEEWRARIKATPGLLGKLRVVAGRRPRQPRSPRRRAVP